MDPRCTWCRYVFSVDRLFAKDCGASWCVAGCSGEHIGVFNDQVIAATRKQIPEIKAYWLVGLRQNKESKAFEPSVESILKRAHELQASGVDIQANREFVNADFIKLVRSANLELHVWTVNDAAIAGDFQRLGVDSITTDRPAELRAELKAP